MLALTKKTDYALIALLHLAKRPGNIVSAREIAGIYRVPLPILTNILKTLAHAGVLISERGAAGGYGLARPAASITLHELIAAIEGPFQFVRCSPTEAETTQSCCDIKSSCPIRLPAYRIRARLEDFFDNVTLAELMEDETAPVGAQPAHLTEPSVSTVGEMT